jgi:hypothetical protein
MSGAAKALVSIDPTLLRGARAEVDGYLIPLMARLEVRFTGSMMLRGHGSAAIRNRNVSTPMRQPVFEIRLGVSASAQAG